MFKIYSKSFIFPEIALFTKTGDKPDKVVDVKITSTVINENEFYKSQTEFNFKLDVNNKYQFDSNKTFLLGIKGTCNTDDGKRSNIKIILTLAPDREIDNIKIFEEATIILDGVNLGSISYYGFLRKYLESMSPESIQMEICSCENLTYSHSYFYIPIDEAELINTIFVKLKSICKELTESYSNFDNLIFISKEKYESIYSNLDRIKHLRDESRISDFIDVVLVDFKDEEILVNISIGRRLLEKLDKDYLKTVPEYISINPVEEELLSFYN